MKTVSAFLLLLAASVAPATAAAPVWDSSGNGLLNGNYYFRQVLYLADDAGNASGFYAYYGNIAFSGTGTYSITNATFLSYDSNGEQGGSAPATGTYSVSASGYGFLSSPIVTGANLYFLVSNHIVIGSETESGDNDMFVAAPIGSLSNSSFQGAYTISAMFPGGTADSAADASYQLNPDGAGHLNNVSVSGYTGTGATLNQSSSGIKYSFSNNAAVISWPTNNSASFYSGQEFGYFSPDGNFIFGGSPTGFDMFVGVRNGTPSVPFSGLYYETGIEENGTTGIDSFYGAFNVVAGGDVVGHERILYSGFSAEGTSYHTSYPTSVTNSYQDPSNTVQYTIGQDGVRISYGTGGYLGIGVALPYTPPAPSGAVYIDPTGIVNSASSAPYTAGISPGEIITFYNGVNLANSTVVAPGTVPFPTVLGKVKVLIDGLAAPIYYVSSTQVSAVVPYEVSTFPIATLQISNNGVLSNIATTQVNVTTPGVFTSDIGIGAAAMLDFPAGGSYFIVSADQPANAGDPVAVYLTGVGATFPANPDGAAAPDGGDTLVQTINVDLGGTDVGALGYVGLSYLPGFYQINFTIPATTAAGNYSLGIGGPDSYTNESTVPISGGANSSVRAPSEARPAVHRKTLPRLNRPTR